MTIYRNTYVNKIQHYIISVINAYWWYRKIRYVVIKSSWLLVLIHGKLNKKHTYQRSFWKFKVFCNIRIQDQTSYATKHVYLLWRTIYKQEIINIKSHKAVNTGKLQKRQCAGTSIRNSDMSYYRKQFSHLWSHIMHILRRCLIDLSLVRATAS